MIIFTSLTSDTYLRQNTPNAYIAVLPAQISSSAELLQQLSISLKLPTYFGFNWNALDECLQDFHWLPEKAILLFHCDLPSLPDKDLMTYIDILSTTGNYWDGNNTKHTFTIVFPTKYESTIVRLKKLFKISMQKNLN